MGQRKKLLAVDEAYVAMYVFLPTPVFKINQINKSKERTFVSSKFSTGFRIKRRTFM